MVFTVRNATKFARHCRNSSWTNLALASCQCQYYEQICILLKLRLWVTWWQCVINSLNARGVTTSIRFILLTRSHSRLPAGVSFCVPHYPNLLQTLDSHLANNHLATLFDSTSYSESLHFTSSPRLSQELRPVRSEVNYKSSHTDAYKFLVVLFHTESSVLCIGFHRNVRRAALRDAGLSVCSRLEV